MSNNTPSALAFASNRSPVLARRGVVASSQPLASQVGLSILMQGGNAADAAVAMAAALNVTEPTSTGIGGDCFALYYEAATQRVTALNGSGRAPGALTLDLIERQGLNQNGALPPYHAHTVTVPGACAGWCDLIGRHGSLPLSNLLAPAIRLAEEGFPVAPLTAHYWSRGAAKQLKTAPGGQALTLGGRAPRAGEVFRNPGLARTLGIVAEGGSAAYYQGDIARDIAATVQAAGGVMTAEDLAQHTSTWDDAISVTYRGLRVWECPPNGQGLTALLALSILAGFELAGQDPLGVERWHLLIEALRVAFADTRWHVADPRFAPAPLAGLLSADYAAERRRLIDRERASLDVRRGAPAAGAGTVYCCAVDGQGNACSFINSNYLGFGTGMVPAGAAGPWGFTLQNRGHNFSLEAGHPNALAPGKRPYHTIIPGFVTRDGEPVMSFGLMGGTMQPQGHTQLMVRLADYGQDPQSAIDGPRFRIMNGLDINVEPSFPGATLAELARRGHRLVQLPEGYMDFGCAQIALKVDGGYVCASDARRDSLAVGF